MSVLDVTSQTWFDSLSAAITGSAANDVIQISAGSYVEDFPKITHSLSIDAIGGMAYLTTPNPTPANGRAILDVPVNQNVSLSINGLVLSGAVDAYNNGAGILFEVGNANLIVTNSWVYGNQDGILTGYANSYSTGGMTVTIDHSEINNNGVAASNPSYGNDHNLYIGAVDQLTVTNSYIHDALGGHEIKSRALASTIQNNRIFDGPTATTSYSIDLPDGGVGVVTGNVIEKGPATPNKYVIHFAGEGTYADSSLLVDGNTIINDRSYAVGLLNQSQDSTGANIPATVSNNVLYAIPSSNLLADMYGPPYDSAYSNVFATAPAPTLDTSAPFQPAIAVSEPFASSIFPLALLATALLRRLRPRPRRTATPGCGPHVRNRGSMPATRAAPAHRGWAGTSCQGREQLATYG